MAYLHKTQDIADLCMHCGTCMDSCGFLQEYCDDPGILASSMLSGLYIVKPYIPFLCVKCGKCTESCPEKLDIMGMMEELRIFIRDEDIPLPEEQIFRMEG